jgi:hypothetical protein
MLSISSTLMEILPLYAFEYNIYTSVTKKAEHSN